MKSYMRSTCKPLLSFFKAWMFWHQPTLSLSISGLVGCEVLTFRERLLPCCTMSVVGQASKWTDLRLWGSMGEPGGATAEMLEEDDAVEEEEDTSRLVLADMMTKPLSYYHFGH
jgi:hypothetical protein